MTAKLTASADGSKVLIGNAAEDALEIDATAKTVKALSPYTLAGNGPAFKASRGQTNFSGTSTDAPLVANVEEFDTNAEYNNVTGRFNPQVAGYYQVNLITLMDAGGGNLIAYSNAVLLKNGANVGNGNYTFFSGSTSRQNMSQLSTLVYMNGTTDYLQAGHSSSVTALCSVSVPEFSASLVRAA